MNYRVLITLFFLSVLVTTNALSQSVNYRQNDSIKQSLSNNIDSMLNDQSDYLTNNEVEHQKLLRNIFAVSFVVMMALLVFTTVFYGRKIRKVSSVILMQNEVLNSTKDQLVKIINIFNYIDRQVYITDAKGNIEWHNLHASNWFVQDYEKEKISLISKFADENKGQILQGINDVKIVSFDDEIFGQKASWKMVPVKNSKDEFANMVFVGSSI
jgi:hypothetical protein